MVCWIKHYCQYNHYVHVRCSLLVYGCKVKVMILCPVILTCITTNTWYVTVCNENNVCRWIIDIDHILPANQECVVRTRKGGAGKRSKYIDRNNKVAIFRDAWAKWYQIYSGGAFHSGEATYKIWRILLQPFLRYEHSNQNFLLVLFFAHFAEIAIAHTCMLQSGWNLVHVMGI